MITVSAVSARRFRREKTSSFKKVFTFFILTSLVLLLSAFSVANWFSIFPDFISKKGMKTSCVNFTDPQRARYDSLKLLPDGEKYMWYSPHEGFSNQARELGNALEIAMLLNRTLILPPVVDHGTVKFGRCLKPRYPSQRKLKERSWSAVRRHILETRYVSIADIVDLRSISPSLVRTIDLRVFLALWCGLDITPICSGPKCRSLADSLSPHWGSMAVCRHRLFPSEESPSCMVYEVEDYCPTTIWTYGETPSTRNYLEHQLMQKMRKDPDLFNNTSVMAANSEYGLKVIRKDIVRSLGSGSEADRFFLLSFGSLFSRMYKHMELNVNLRAPDGDPFMATKLQAIKSGHSFTVEIMRNARTFVGKKLGQRPYFCAHVRLADGAFLNIWDKILPPLKKKLEELANRKKLDVFLMTDLAREKWKGTVLEEINANDQYEVHTLDGQEDFITRTAQQLMVSEHGVKLGFFPGKVKSSGESRQSVQKYVPNVRLYLEEVICTCASLGFLGTFRSTITSNINDLRNASLCPVHDFRWSL